jgi:cation transport ATPase
MSAIDWLALGLLLALPAAFFCAFFLYLRTAYRKGGWRAVRTASLVAIGAIAVFLVERIVAHFDLEPLRKVFGR